MNDRLTWGLFSDGHMEVRHPAFGHLKGSPEEMVRIFDAGLNVAQQAMEHWAAQREGPAQQTEAEAER